MSRIRRWGDIKALAGTSDGLTDAELQLLEACRRGESCTLGDGSRPEMPDIERNIRAELLCYLIKGGCADCAVPDGVRVLGAYVTGALQLSFERARGGIAMHHCRFEGEIVLVQTIFEHLSLSGSAVTRIMAQNIRVAGQLLLDQGFVSSGEIVLAGCTVGGQLGCVGARLLNQKGYALNAESAQIGAGVFLADGFSASGIISFNASRIGGEFACSGGQFDNADGVALNLIGATIEGYLLLNDGFRAVGRVSIASAHVRYLSCVGASFENNERIAFDASHVEIAGAANFSDEMQINGTLCLDGATIGGNLDCTKALFFGSKGFSILARGAKVGGSAVLGSAIYDGGVNFQYAKIEGGFNCTSSRFKAVNEYSIMVQDAEIRGGVFLNNMLAEGEISFQFARIGGQVECVNSTFQNGNNVAFNGLRMKAGAIIWWQMKVEL